RRTYPRRHASRPPGRDPGAARAADKSCAPGTLCGCPRHTNDLAPPRPPMRSRLIRARIAMTLGLILSLRALAAPDSLTLNEIAAGVFVHPGKPLPLDAPGHDDIANI